MSGSLVRNWFLSLLCLIGAVGCGGPAPVTEDCGLDCNDGAGGSEQRIDDDEVDYAGFTVAPPPGPDDPFNGKDSFEQKLNDLLESTQVPSALAGAFFQLSRAYLSGRAPTTEIEESAFAILDDASPEVIAAIERTLVRIDELPAQDMEKLYGMSFLNASPTAPLTHSMLLSAVSAELEARVNLAELGEAYPEVPLGEERAGLVRDWTHYTVEGPSSDPLPNVCRVKTQSMSRAIRTGNHVPRLSSWQYERTETEEDCLAIGGCIKVEPPSCKVEASAQDGIAVCLASPRVQGGETVRLEGFNFHDVDATVELTDIHGDVVSLDAHVRGDSIIPADAEVDCDVSDVIVFQVPRELPTGHYRVDINVDDPRRPGQTLTPKESLLYIDVVPPVTTRFQFAVEEFTSMNDTGEYFSDEIGLKIVTIPVLEGGELGEMNLADGLDSKLGDVDRNDRICLGDVRAGGQCVGRDLFSGLVGAGFAFTVIGYEIDNQGDYEETVNAYLGVVAEITKSNWDHIAAGVGGFAGLIATYVGGPGVGTLVAGIVGAAIKGAFWAWAPADLVIEDVGSMTFHQMAELTSVNYPNPARTEYESPLGVAVVVAPCENVEDDELPGCGLSAKLPGQYRESRRYGVGLMDSCDGPLPLFMTRAQCELIGSEFQLTFRYNRLD